jgi:predicted SAM-dependent methyltransferase
MLKAVFQHLPAGWQDGLRRGRAALRRRSGSRRLRRQLRAADEWKIVVGTSGVFEPGWIPTDIEYLNLLEDADWRNFFTENSIAALLAEHVWEHLTPAQGLQAAQACHRYLRPGGRLRIAVPDGRHPDPAYLRQVMIHGTGAGADDHKVLYTHETLCTLLKSAGFSVVPLEYFDAAGTFHFHEWNRADGMVHRSSRYDARNADGKLAYTSLIMDAFKP